MSLIKGFDTTDSVLGHAHSIKNAGYSFVIKYGADSDTFPNKRFTHEEVAGFKEVGLSCGFVWERGNTMSTFTAEQGKIDAEAFVAYLKELGVPTNLTVCGYFAVDLDVTRAQIMGPVADYFKVAWAVMRTAGYLTGVYGSGLVCQALKNAGYAHYAWKANANGWSDFAWTGWDVLQHTGSVTGFASDPDDAVSLEGFWTP